ncbi:MAG: peptidoglycan DD-metalloendopeptidase family protein [Ignavibacteria bacterium]|nr:peptidoglycan DD-metalloendopeptidase family protein [Ignavibacteria bacterium]
MVKLKVIFFISVFGLSFLFAQRTSDIQSKKQELNKIRQEIEQLDKKLKETLSKEKQNLEIIDEYDKQLKLLNSLIKKLEEEENKLNNEIKIRENDLRIAEKELSELRNEYEKSIVNLYKYGRINPLELLLTSKSVNQALLRYKYLEKFTEDRKHRIELINRKALQVQTERENLLTILNEKEKLKQEKTVEENQLKDKLTEKRNYVGLLRKNKEALVRDLERKKESAKKIAEIIDQLIEKQRKEEIAARQREIERRKQQQKIAEQKRTQSKSNVDQKQPEFSIKQKDEQPISQSEYDDMFEQIPQFTSFSRMKGNLPWPVNGRIVNRFGEQRNPYLNTVTLNFGIDIATPFGSPVRAIADGRVSIVHWLPGYGNIVIITHSEGYRTVYAYLSEVNVSEGQIVKRGDVIATSGESLSGEMVHLEIWKEREKQNPEHWLANR